MLKNRSGQFVYFTLVSALSGNPVTGAVAAISGRKSLDGLSGMILISGTFTELGGGSYRANLYDFDVNGDQVGFQFQASGCVPVQYQFDMIDGNASGRVYLGHNVSVASGQLSGQQVTTRTNSDKDGYTVTSGTTHLASGSPVLVYSGQLSGQQVTARTVTDKTDYTVTSGTTWLVSGNIVVPASGSLSGQLVAAFSGAVVTADVARWKTVVPNSLIASGRLDAAFNVRTNVARSGTATTIQLDAGAPTEISGIYDGHVITIIGGSGQGESRVIKSYDSSGNITVATPWFVPAFADSIFTITPSAVALSGVVQIASGTPVVPYSGQLSGQQLTARTVTDKDGYTVTSGTTFLASGSPVLVYSGQLSGQQVTTRTNTDKTDYTLLSGTTFLASGSITSGTIISGIFVTAAVTLNSGTVYLASGHPATLYSGQEVMVYSGNLSGQQVTARTVSDKTGYTVLSGTTFLASGSITSGVISSGVYVTLPWQAAWDDEVQSEVNDALVANNLHTIEPRLRGLVMAQGSIGSVGNSTTTLHLAGLSYGDDELNNYLIVIFDTSESEYHSRWIEDWDLSDELATVATLPFTPQSDSYWLTSIRRDITVSDKTGYTVLSGTTFLASGSVTSGVISSGVFVTAAVTLNSGTIYLASGHPTTLYSGQEVMVYSGNLSGQQVTTRTNSDKTGYTVLSGTTFLASGSITSGVISSGVFVTAVATINSGELWLASGHPATLYSGQEVIVYSGSLSGQQVTARTVTDKTGYTVLSGTTFIASGSITSGTIISGIFVTAGVSIASGTMYLASGHPVTLYSGQEVMVYSGNLSGQQVTARTVSDKTGYTVLSGTTFLASGSVTSGVISSGVFVTAVATINSGDVYLASGHPTTLYSGQEVMVYSGNLSGQQVTARTVTDKTGYTVLSGTTFIASGSITSGTIISGIFVTAGVSIASGTMYLASGHPVTLYSGQEVLVYSGNLSGQQVTTRTNSDKTGYSLLSGTTWLTSGHPAALYSGQEVLVYSGNLSGQEVTARTVSDKTGYTVLSGTTWLTSGHRAALYSGQEVGVYSGNLSGQQLTARTVSDKTDYTVTSGSTFLASGSITSGVISSGVFVTATATVQSGALFLASGHFLFGSGLFHLASGSPTIPYSGQLSGQFVDAQVVRDKSGYTANTLSGTTQLASGNVLPYSGSISVNTFASGVLSAVIPDKVLLRGFSAVSGNMSGDRNLLNAGRKLQNRADLNSVSGYISIYEEDDTTIAYQQPLVTTSGAPPISRIG